MRDNHTRGHRDIQPSSPRPHNRWRGHTFNQGRPAPTEQTPVETHEHGQRSVNMRNNSTRHERGAGWASPGQGRGYTHEHGRPGETEHPRIGLHGRGRGSERDGERGHGPGPRHGGPEGRPDQEGHGGGRGRWHYGRGEGRERLERGLLRYVILDVLSYEPRHGYELIKQIEERTQGRYMPSPGTLYPTLQYLEDLGFVDASQDEGRKVYRLTTNGSAELEQHAEETRGFWARFAASGGTDANQYEVSFLRDALDDLSRTVWSSLRAAMSSADTATIRAVRRAVEQCQNEIRDIVAEAGRPHSEGNPRPQDEL